jgi:NAD(P)H-hydrate epimerase
MKITTADEMRAIDRRTYDQFHIPSLTLMENAGAAVADFALAKYSEARSITIVCGKGNNGGDGFVAARRLHEAGKAVRILLLADAAELRGDAAEMYQKIPAPPTFVRSEDELRAVQELFNSDLLIDAILGTGFRPPVTGLYASAIAMMNAAAAPVVAVDIPSGADADAMLPQQEHLVARADGIVTFTAPRPAHLFSLLTRGVTWVAPIGSPDEAILSELKLEAITARDIISLLAPRELEGQKGNYGHVLVVGGSVGKAGAAAMAGMGALRAGAGLATVATAQSALPMVAGFIPELMTEALPETDVGSIAPGALDYGRLDGIVKGKTVLALGPGISRHPETVQFVRRVIDRYPLALVVDADGLNAFEGAVDKLEGEARPLVLTPHPGEMARLTGLSTNQIQQDRGGVARGFARAHNCIVVLKGHRTLVAQPEGTVWVNTTGNPGMAKGGTGDVLTGMIAGLLAQHPDDVARAVAAGVFLHGLAGDIACEIMGEQSMLATDMLACMPQAFYRAKRWAEGKYQRIGP